MPDRTPASVFGQAVSQAIRIADKRSSGPFSATAGTVSVSGSVTGASSNGIDGDMFAVDLATPVMDDSRIATSTRDVIREKSHAIREVVIVCRRSSCREFT